MISISGCKYINVCVHMHVHGCIHVCVRVCLDAWVYERLAACVCIPVCVCVCVCMHACMYNLQSPPKVLKLASLALPPPPQSNIEKLPAPMYRTVIVDKDLV